jgi:hypothetical protein
MLHIEREINNLDSDRLRNIKVLCHTTLLRLGYIRKDITEDRTYTKLWYRYNGYDCYFMWDNILQKVYITLSNIETGSIGIIHTDWYNILDKSGCTAKGFTRTLQRYNTIIYNTIVAYHSNDEIIIIEEKQ